MKLLSNCRRSYLTMFCSAEILVDTQVAIEPKKASSICFFTGLFTVSVTMED